MYFEPICKKCGKTINSEDDYNILCRSCQKELFAFWQKHNKVNYEKALEKEYKRGFQAGVDSTEPWTM